MMAHFFSPDKGTISRCSTVKSMSRITRMRMQKLRLQNQVSARVHLARAYIHAASLLSHDGIDLSLDAFALFALLLQLNELGNAVDHSLHELPLTLANAEAVADV